MDSGLVMGLISLDQHSVMRLISLIQSSVTELISDLQLNHLQSSLFFIGQPVIPSAAL